MWIIGVMRGKTRLNITKTGLRTISDFVNWIRVMQAFGGQILCMLMYANVSVKTRPKQQDKLFTNVRDTRSKPFVLMIMRNATPNRIL